MRAGSVDGVIAAQTPLPSGSRIDRYILTSAQNNTFLHPGVWRNILALKEYYNATLYVGTFTYDMNSYGEMSVKRGTCKAGEEKTMKYAPELTPYIKDDRIQIGAGLVWCGDQNIMPTSGDPLSRKAAFEGRKSCIFPHAKIAMRSVAATGGSGAKLLYTTGTVTQKNYIHKEAGLLAEMHHTYGGLIVEVDSQGTWEVRQLDAESDSGTICDLDLKVEKGVVTDGHRVEAIIYGDIHATCIDSTVLALSATAPGNMIDTLRPKYVFIHDLIEGASVNHHDAKKPMARHKTHKRGLTSVAAELQASADVLKNYYRPDLQIIVVNSNHDRWLDRFLDEPNVLAVAPCNLEIFYGGNAARVAYQDSKGATMNVLEYLLHKHTDFTTPARFLAVDEPFVICDKRIDCGQHGDLGPNGTRGSARALAPVGRRSVVAHYHTAGIWDGLYVVGTSTVFRMGFNIGPSSWTHSHCIVYENGKRSIITMFENKWKS